MKAYEKVDLLILDEWLIRCLVPEETCAMLELIEARTRHGATIFCTQFETEGWYSRIDPDPESGSPICEAIGLRTTLTIFWWTVKSPCGNGTG